MVSCCILGCPSRTERKTPNITFFTYQQRAQSAYQQHFPQLTQNRRVLTFREDEITPTICNEVNEIENVRAHQKSIDRNVIENNLPDITTALQLVQTAEILENVSNVTNSASYDLINPVIIGNTAHDLITRKDGSHDDVCKPGSSASNDKAKQYQSDEIDWNNMFDTELFSEAAIKNAELVLKQIETPVQNNFHIQFSQHTSKNTNVTEIDQTKQCNPSKGHINKTKRKNQLITNDIPKKVKKVSEKIKTTFRKQKYTKAVKNWLNDPNNTVEKDEVRDTNNVEIIKPIKQAELTVEKETGCEKPSKKIIQAQLANKDGIMKFGKPKLQNTNEQDKTEPSVIVLEKGTNCSVHNKTGIKEKEKKIKPKFVPPIKSQIPVKDVEFKVINVKSDTTDSMTTLRSITNQDIAIVLIYSNGFSQLNNQHTEYTCKPEGILININDDCFYFNGCLENDREALQSFLENNTIVCYEGKALLIYFKCILDLDVYNIDMIDVQIGGCLLDPDNLPENFSELQKLLSFTPQFTIATECVLQKTAWYVSLLKECSLKLVNMLKEEQLWKIFVEIEMKLLPIVADMERLGVTVDLQKLKSMEDILLAKLKSTELECYKAAGKNFQINSPVQVRELIYEELQLDTKCNVKIRETLAKGAKSTSESMLKGLVSVHPLPRLILEYRHLHKAHATFLTGIAQHIKDGVVRPTWVQMAASTGRIASNNPNLQAIPKAPFSLTLFHKDDASAADSSTLSFRSVYVSREGCQLVAADFQHVECRVFAHAAADAPLQAALLAPGDLFRRLAAQWLNKSECEVSAADRERTKRIVYASLYGAGARKLGDILDVPYEQALAVLASFNRTFPSLRSFGRSVVSRCERRGGRLATLCGRARRLRNITSPDFALKAQAERQAVNFVVQGSAADLCKLAMVGTSEALRRHRPPLQARLLLQIHDELVWEVRRDHVRAAAGTIQRVMEACGRAAGLPSLPVRLSVGGHWGDMRQYRPDPPTP